MTAPLGELLLVSQTKRRCAVALAWRGILNVLALAIGALQLWGAARSVWPSARSFASRPPLPDRASMIGWSVVVFASVLVVVLMRRLEVEA